LDKVFSRHPSAAERSSPNGHHTEGSYHDSTSPDDEQAHSQPLLDQTAALPPAQEEMSSEKLCILTGLILVSTFIIALCVDDLGLILGFVGSVGSTSISFIVSGISFSARKALTFEIQQLPGILFSSLHEDGHRSRLRRRAQVLAIYGCVVLVVCLAANIVKVYKSVGSSKFDPAVVLV
jgi:hypothetical protein